MNDTQIANVLRGATRQGVIQSWTLLPNGDWTINAEINGARNLTPDQARGYCRMLVDAGVEPLATQQTCTDCGTAVRGGTIDRCPHCSGQLTT